MLVLMLIALGLGAFTMVYLWVASARLDKIEERQKKIKADLKRRKKEFKKAQSQERKIVLSKTERENFELFKKILECSNEVEYNGVPYIKVGDNLFRNEFNQKLYTLDEKGWREINGN